MRAPRWLLPEAVHFVTNRCEREQFLLLPSAEMNNIIGGWFARALETFGKGIEIYAFVFMSNHFHILLKDNHGNLPAFMWYFQTNVAKAVNKYWGRKGRVFARRYDAALIKSDANLLDRFQYTLTNPVRADIVEKCGQWRGLSSYAATVEGEPLLFKQFDAVAYERAVKMRGKKNVNRRDFVRLFRIPIDSPECLKDMSEEERGEYVEEMVIECEENQRVLREGECKGVVGMEKALAYEHTYRPENPSFRNRVVLFCRDPELRRETLEARRMFISIYLETSHGFRKAAYLGQRPMVEWPAYSCPPTCMRPVGYEHAA
jgi:putative transposase